MSRGLGHVERTILRVIKRQPALSAFDIADEAHPSGRLTRGQYVSALRAMRNIATKFPKRFVLIGGKGSAPLRLCTRRYWNKYERG
jgi:hypothetical protein